MSEIILYKWLSAQTLVFKDSRILKDRTSQLFNTTLCKQNFIFIKSINSNWHRMTIVKKKQKTGFDFMIIFNNLKPQTVSSFYQLSYLCMIVEIHQALFFSKDVPSAITILYFCSSIPLSQLIEK